MRKLVRKYPMLSVIQEKLDLIIHLLLPEEITNQDLIYHSFLIKHVKHISVVNVSFYLA